MPGLNIVVGATVTNANQALQSVSQNLAAVALNAAKVSGSLDASAAALIPLQNNLRNFEAALKKATNAGEVQYLTRNINILKASIASLQNGAPGAAKITRDFTGLSRVIQDLPFGFVAISNNLTQILPAAGAAGLAISAIVSAVTFAQVGFSSWTRGMGKAKEELDKTVISIHNYADALKAGFENSGKEIANLQVLAKVAQDTALPMETRRKAVDELQKMYPAYLKNISDEAILTGQAKDAINEINKALIAKAYYEAASTKLTDLAGRQLQLQREELILQNNQRQIALDLTKAAAEEAQKGLVLGGSTIAPVSGTAITKVDELKAKLQGVNEQVQANKVAQSDFNKQFDFFLNQAEKFKAKSIDLDPDPNGKTAEKIDRVAELLRKLAIDRDELARNPLLSFQEKDQKAFDLINSAINGLRDLKVATGNPIIVKLRADLDDLAAQIQSDKFRDRLKKTGIGNVVQIPVSFAITNKKSGLAEVITRELADLDKYSGKAQKQLQKLLFSPEAFQAQMKDIAAIAQNQADIISGTFTNILESVGENIGSGHLFEGIFKVFGEGLKALGKNLIETSTLVATIRKALNTALGGNPIAGIGVGVGLIALGTLLENSLPKFAQGGIVTQATLGIFGEAGPEAVMPLNKLKDFINTQNSSPASIELTSRIRGGDIFLSNSRTEQSRRRVYGKP